MACAKKCDRCGKLYEQYILKTIEKILMGSWY